MDGTRPVPPKTKVRGAKLAPPKPATLGTWIAGARPQSLVLAIVPVALGTAAAAQVMTHWYDHWVRALLSTVYEAGLTDATPDQLESPQQGG